MVSAIRQEREGRGTHCVGNYGSRDLNWQTAISATDQPASKAFSPWVLTHERLFVSTMPGLDSKGGVPSTAVDQVATALDHLTSVLKAAGLTEANMVFVNPYPPLIYQCAS
jgi:enamine deaminase RidA (YjgF/YER057c/UK114 family)